jgi:hypothetical protein
MLFVNRTFENRSQRQNRGIEFANRLKVAVAVIHQETFPTFQAGCLVTATMSVAVIAAFLVMP